MITYWKNKFKERIKKIVVGHVSEVEPMSGNEYRNDFYAQIGEDVLLRHIFHAKPSGFYVDIGAHHPQRYSNTYKLYLQGWHGINIDAMPNSMDAFNILRPRDINLELAISDRQQTLTYNIFNEPALNSFCSDISSAHEENERFYIIDKREIRTHTLKEVLDQYLPSGQQIDILSVDVEGLDYEVLASNDWQKYRPSVVVFEALDALTLREINDCRASTLLQQHGYAACFKIYHNMFYLDERFVTAIKAAWGGSSHEKK